ncbi:peptide-methionine (R)-S-oxide reductase MsrB [Parvibaculum sp.]|uniref:peptide-methionine (R)-S-oxide reductase MsrB n=1 Tax=Parvibaculum sp. TaxID=2024848 RepID=UPI00320D1620
MSDKSRPKVVKSDTEWRKELTPEQYQVTRQAGTERAFTGPWLDEHRKGTFHCVACGTPLFRSETKYESGSGWPSFFAPIAPEAIEELEDVSHGMRRVEARCATCEAHLGHVFPDGPRPTGLRFCMNGTALDFEPDDEQEAP